MSKIGTQSISLPSSVSFLEEADQYVVKGPKGTQNVKRVAGIKVTNDNGSLQVEREDDGRQTRAFHGLIRSLLSNAVVGVVDQFKKELQLVGVGYRAKHSGKDLELALGYSMPRIYILPEGIQAEVPEPTQIILQGVDKQKVGQVAAEIRSLRPPEPYKGKGVRYKDENVRRKAGKTGAKK